MHNCEEFRERITEYIIDREDVAAKTEFRHELLMCSGCSEFYAESREMMETLSSVDLTVSESQWWGIERRLCATLLHAPAEKRGGKFGDSEQFLNPRKLLTVPGFTTPFLIAAAALVLVTIGLSRVVPPLASPQAPAESAQMIFVEHSPPLDPGTVDFLEESELLLRNVMKMAPTDVEDLADARKVAGEQLAGLEQRKEAAADVPPVVGVMETYETVLRDLRNVDERNADEDISDIQKRIQKNGLIANMKAFQPRVTEMSFGLR